VSLRHGGDAKSVNQMKKNENIIIKKKKKKKLLKFTFVAGPSYAGTGTTG